MKSVVSQAEMKALVGKQVYVLKKDGTQVSGKLVRIKGNEIIIKPIISKGKVVQTKAIIPLVLFDLLAIGTSPFGFGGGFGRGFGGGFGRGFGGGFDRGFGGGFGRGFGGGFGSGFGVNRNFF
jgi:hypothetical protein